MTDVDDADTDGASAPLLQTRGLTREFVVRDERQRKATLVAVEDVDLDLRTGESFGLVGESGSGKSTVARMICRLLAPTRGQIVFDGTDITAVQGAALRRARRDIQIVFQDPHASLNPRKQILFSVAEPLVIHEGGSTASRRERVVELLEIVGLGAGFLYRYPHELSGGQKQRVCIARAVALNPRLLVLDEPTSALDVSVQAQILEFLADLKQRLDLSYLFISHNLAVVRHLCDRVGVMYLGRLVERGSIDEVFGEPRHPYTKALLSAVPQAAAEQRGGRVLLRGDVPSPVERPEGCGFHPRCGEKMGEVCERIRPDLKIGSGSGVGREVACHLWGE